MKTRHNGRDRTIHPASLGLTTAEIEKIIDDVAKETARMEKENRGRFCCTCGAPLPRKHDIPAFMRVWGVAERANWYRWPPRAFWRWLLRRCDLKAGMGVGVRENNTRSNAMSMEEAR